MKETAATDLPWQLSMISKGPEQHVKEGILTFQVHVVHYILDTHTTNESINDSYNTIQHVT